MTNTLLPLLLAACTRCDGGREVRYAGRLVPCPDCCCPVCGVVTGGGMCPPHDAADFLAADDAFRRRTDV